MVGQVRREDHHLTGERMVERQQAGGLRLMVKTLWRMEALPQAVDQTPMEQLELRMAQAGGQRLFWPPFS